MDKISEMWNYLLRFNISISTNFFLRYLNMISPFSKYTLKPNFTHLSLLLSLPFSILSGCQFRISYQVYYFSMSFFFYRQLCMPLETLSLFFYFLFSLSLYLLYLYFFLVERIQNVNFRSVTSIAYFFLSPVF